jgi:hypothetical protein
LYTLWFHKTDTEDEPVLVLNRRDATVTLDRDSRVRPEIQGYGGQIRYAIVLSAYCHRSAGELRDHRNTYRNAIAERKQHDIECGCRRDWCGRSLSDTSRTEGDAATRASSPRKSEQCAPAIALNLNRRHFVGGGALCGPLATLKASPVAPVRAIQRRRRARIGVCCAR